MRRAWAVSIVAWIAAAPAFAANDAGLPGDFLNEGAGARPMGMGGAFTAVADDIDALYWNPAGLAEYRSSQVEFEHRPLELQGSQDLIAYSQPIYAHGHLGLGILNVGSPSVPRIDENNVEIGSFDHRETGYLLGYAQRFGDRLNAGANLKMAENSTDGRTKRGFGADLAALIHLNERVRVGAVLRNAIAPRYDFGPDGERFPTIARAGAAVDFFHQHVTTDLDLDKTIGTPQAPHWHFGLEGFVIDNIFVRGGVDQTSVSAGMGLRWRSLQFDYAAAFETLGLQNRFSVKFRFGGFDVDVKAKPAVFSPTGLHNKVTFSLQTTSRERIVNWIFTIRNAKDEVVWSAEGYNTPPDTLEWDGKTTQGQIVAAGRYTYRMATTDAQNRTEKTPARSITVVAPSPVEIEAR